MRLENLLMTLTTAAAIAVAISPDIGEANSWGTRGSLGKAKRAAKTQLRPGSLLVLSFLTRGFWHGTSLAGALPTAGGGCLAAEADTTPGA